MSRSIKEILDRRAAKVLPDIDGLDKLSQQKKLRIYLGVDPTGSRLHLGHSIAMRVLNDLANDGHECIYLFGTGTVLVGDPSLRKHAREQISAEQIDENISNWEDQAEKIVDLSKITIKKNGDWINKLNITELIQLMSNVSAQQLFKRESFTRRIEAGGTVGYHETLYPLLQGYDSVVLDVDAEIGGTDQEFNMLMGRELQRKLNQKDKWVIEVPMIVGVDGQPMSKTSNNCIWLDDDADEIYGKVMRLPDQYVWEYLRLVTDVVLAEIDSLKAAVEAGANPKQAKVLLAKEIITNLHSPTAANQAEETFDRQFSKRELPEDIEQIQTQSGKRNLAKLLLELKLVSSKSEARRLLTQSGIKLNQSTVNSETVTIQSGDVIQIGKRKFVKIK